MYFCNNPKSFIKQSIYSLKKTYIMAKSTTPKGTKASEKTPTNNDILMEKLKTFIRVKGQEFLKDKNINSIGIGFKQKKGKYTDEICLQFTVNQKAEKEQFESLSTTAIPTLLDIDGTMIPTDVIQRSYMISKLVLEAAPSARKIRINPIVPGISVGHVSISAGTVGCIVYDNNTGTPYILSNWHVLHSEFGQIGDIIVQPGPHDDNRVSQNQLGKLVRSHLGHAGDCAIATIEGRQFKTNILDLNVTPEQLGIPELGDILIKSGRTTNVTYGRVTRIDVLSRINYGEGVGDKEIGGFELSIERTRKPRNGEISQGGDSGAVWLFTDNSGKAINVLGGLHFGGESDGNPDEFALACYPKSVFEKLEITLKKLPPTNPTDPTTPTDNNRSIGFDSNFLSKKIPFPKLKTEISNDAFSVNGSNIINYVHFSLILNKQRRLATIVGWNIDGGKFLSLNRNGIKFKFDTRIPENFQMGEEIYSRNRLDRGHIARRADLVWGTPSEAKQANVDSFHFTNIAPQMDNFNQTGAGGIWGRLEDAVFQEVDVENLRISVFGGSVFNNNDKTYRGAKIPKEFFKIIVYIEQGRLKVKAFLLSQNINQIEILDLDAFKVYQLSISEVSDRTKIDFPRELIDADTFVVPQAISEIETERKYLSTIEEIVW
jgi:endonuclease G, mitochondrial